MERIRVEQDFYKPNVGDNGGVPPGFALPNRKPDPNGRRAHGNLVLSGMRSEVLKKLRPYMKEVVLAKDDYIYQQDELIDCVYFPETAVISEFQILEDGRTIEVAVTGREGVVGIVSAFGSCVATNCTQVCVAGSVLKLKSDILEREIALDSSLLRKLHEPVNAHIRQLSQKVICNTYHTLEQRLCTWLLSLSERSGSNKLRLTQEHVARVLGVHRPSVTCIAQILRERGYIEYARGRIIIRDRGGLEDHACTCYEEMRLDDYK